MSDTMQSHAAVSRRGARYWVLLGAAAGLPLVTSTVWYIEFGDAYAVLLAERGIEVGPPEAWQGAAQLVRNGVVVAVLAIVMRRLRITHIGGALRLGFQLWLGLQAMAVLGSVVHEQYPLGLYLIHVGDALQATLLMSSLIALANRRSTS